MVSQESGEKTTSSEFHSQLAVSALLAQDGFGASRLLWAIIVPDSFTARLDADKTAQRPWGMNSKYEALEFFLILSVFPWFVSFILAPLLYKLLKANAHNATTHW